MANPDLDQPTDGEAVADGDAPSSSFSSGCSEGLGLLVWLGQLARDESTRRPLQFGIAESLDPPRSIGRFQLESLLGAGAYGAVFRALDTQLGRRVALKLAWPGVLMDPVASRRFVEEPKTVASLKHRGIVEVHDSGEIEMAAFIALELVDGPTLAQWLKDQEHVSPRLAAQIVRSVAEAVHFAHERGIIHRDLKPGNVLLRPGENRDAFGYEPVVTDFGLARRTRLPEMSNLTGTQAIIGTDHYMSPEQAGGRGGDVGPASDIFSLGVILYELAAGRRPFDGESSEQVRQRIQQDEAPAIRPWRNSVPKDLETIALKCLEKAPGRRYASAQELADDLGRFLGNKPILARPIGVVQRAWKLGKRKPLVVSLVSLGVVSVLAIAGLAGAWIRDGIENARRIAQAEEAAANSDGLQRQQQYVTNIRRAAEALQNGGRREMLEHLEKCRTLAHGPVHRGIVWDWLWAQANDADVTLHAHPKGVKSVRFHPAGDRLISAGKDGRIIVWDAATWAKRQELRYSDSAEVTVCEFSADGSLLAAGGEDGRLAVYRMADGSLVLDEQVIKGRVFELVWIGDTTELAVGGDGATLWIVDALNGKRRSKTLEVPSESRAAEPSHPDEISGLAFVARRNSLAVFLRPAVAYFVDPVLLETQSPSLAKNPSAGAVCNVASGYIATGDGYGIRVWTTRDGSMASNVAMSRHIQCMRYSSSAGAIAVAFRDGTVQTLDFNDALTGNTPWSRSHLAHTGRAVSVDISPDGTWLASGGWDGNVKLYHHALMKEPLEVPLPGMPFRVKFSPCGRWLAVSDRPTGNAGRLTMFEVRNGKRLWSTACRPQLGESADPPSFASRQLSAFDLSGDEFLIVDTDWSIKARDTRTGRVKKAYSAGDESRISDICTAPDGRSLLIRRPTGEWLILDRRSGETVGGAPATCVGQFHTLRGDVWLDSDESRNLVLRSAPAGAVTMTLPGLADRPEAVSVSPDGRYLAIGGYDRVVYRWDLTRGGLPDKFVGHEAAIYGVSFSPGGRTILSRSPDGTVRFWDASTQSQLLALGTTDERVLSMDLSPAGDLLVCGVQHRTNGRYGLHVYRLGPKRDSLPRTFEFLPTGQP